MSRDKIIEAVRQNKPEEVPLPEVGTFKRNDLNLLDHFAELIEKVGGQAKNIKKTELASFDFDGAFPEAKTICSCSESIPSKGIDLDTIDTPHKLEHVDIAVIEGEFGVAENGAVWVKEEKIRVRALAFITKHLVIIVPKNTIVWNMHEAYKKIEIERRGYGTFISGPSKTADIEQSLVIGAHGPMSLTVFLVEE